MQQVTIRAWWNTTTEWPLIPMYNQEWFVNMSVMPAKYEKYDIIHPKMVYAVGMVSVEWFFGYV